MLIDHLNQPQCPQSFDPVHPAHVALVEQQNALYESAPKDADGEFVNEARSLDLSAGSQMRLYVETASGFGQFHGLYAVEAYFWRCRTCGFVLPCTSYRR